MANEAGLRSLGEAVKRQPRSVRRPAAGPGPRSFGPAFVADPGLAPTGEVADGTAGPQPARSFDRTDERAPAKRRHAKPRSRRRVWLRRGVVIGVVVVLVIVGGGAGYVYYLTHDLNRIRVQGLQGAFTTGKEAGHREHPRWSGPRPAAPSTVQNPAYGLCSEGVNGVNSDVIMILHVDPTHHRLALVSLPRDLFIPNARKEGPNKIDAGLFEGVSQVVASDRGGLRDPHPARRHAQLRPVRQRRRRAGWHQHVLPHVGLRRRVGAQRPGCRVRASRRHPGPVRGPGSPPPVQGAGITTPYANYWPQENLSDLARIRRDHEFLRVLAQAVAKRGLGNPITDINLINSVKADLNFDQSWPVSDMANLVLDFHSVNINCVPQLTLPVSVVEDPDGAGGGLIYQGSGYGDAEFPAEPQDQATINQVLGIGATTDSMTGNPLPAPATVTVSVVNGSGTADQGAATSASLAALGFHMVGASDATPVGDVAETVVYYGSRAPAAEAAAEAVARSMSGAVVMAYDPGQVADGAGGHRVHRHRLLREPAGAGGRSDHDDRSRSAGRAHHHDDRSRSHHDHDDHHGTEHDFGGGGCHPGAVGPDFGPGPVGPQSLSRRCRPDGSGGERNLTPQHAHPAW